MMAWAWLRLGAMQRSKVSETAGEEKEWFTPKRNAQRGPNGAGMLKGLVMSEKTIYSAKSSARGTIA
jgi:hypothetical protein